MMKGFRAFSDYTLPYVLGIQKEAANIFFFGFQWFYLYMDRFPGHLAGITAPKQYYMYIDM